MGTVWGGGGLGFGGWGLGSRLRRVPPGPGLSRRPVCVCRRRRRLARGCVGELPANVPCLMLAQSPLEPRPLNCTICGTCAAVAPPPVAATVAPVPPVVAVLAEGRGPWTGVLGSCLRGWVSSMLSSPPLATASCGSLLPLPPPRSGCLLPRPSELRVGLGVAARPRPSGWLLPALMDYQFPSSLLGPRCSKGACGLGSAVGVWFFGALAFTADLLVVAVASA